MKRRDLLKLFGFGAAAATAPAAAIAATRTAPPAAPATPPVPPATSPAGPARQWAAVQRDHTTNVEDPQMQPLLELCEEFQELMHQDPTESTFAATNLFGSNRVRRLEWQLRINNLKQQIEAEATKLGLKTTWNTHYAYFTQE